MGISKHITLSISAVALALSLGAAQAQEMLQIGGLAYGGSDTLNTVLKPMPGDGCVFCSYGTVPCPPIQEPWQGRWLLRLTLIQKY